MNHKSRSFMICMLRTISSQALQKALTALIQELYDEQEEDMSVLGGIGVGMGIRGPTG